MSPAPQHDLNVTNTDKMSITRGTARDFRSGPHHVVEMAPDETPRLTRPSVGVKDGQTENVLHDRSDTLHDVQLLSGLSVESDTEVDYH